MLPPPPAKSAFSLVELSIVLVILGLLTGGILAGQSLIRAAELRAVTTEYQRYTTAVQTFRDKYFAVPGDFNKATSFWGYQGATGCTNNAGTSIVSTGTCDGNGDGMVYPGAAASNSGEMFQFWRQLAFAGLIEGTYTGLAGANNAWDGVIGTNVPRSKVSNGGWGVQYVGVMSSYDKFYDGDYGNAFAFGGQVGGAIPQSPILKPEEAWNIDTKLDDGKPGTGKVIAEYYDTCATSTSNTDYTGTYRLTSSSPACGLWFAKSF